MDILSDVSVSGNLTAKQLNANSLNFVRNNNENLTIKVGNSCAITFGDDPIYTFTTYSARLNGCLTASIVYSPTIKTTEFYADVLSLTNFDGYGKAIIVDGKRVIDFNGGGVNINDCGGGVRICGSSLTFKTQDGHYSAVGLRLTEFETGCGGSTKKKKFMMQGVDEYHINSSLNVSGALCVAGEANFRNGIVTSRIVVEGNPLMYSMTKSLTIPANCSKFHIITAADDFEYPLPYLATMSNGDEFSKNVNVDYLFNMCNLIGIVTPSEESRNMTFKILKQS